MHRKHVSCTGLSKNDVSHGAFRGEKANGVDDENAINIKWSKVVKTRGLSTALDIK